MLSDELGVAVGDGGRGVDVLVEDGDCARVGVVQRPGTDAAGIQRDPATAYLPLPASPLRTPWRGACGLLCGLGFPTDSIRWLMNTFL